MKTIRKKFQGVMPENKILNSESNSQTDTYSCDYINNMKVDAENVDGLPVGTRVEYNGTEVPDGWEEVEDAYNKGVVLYNSEDGEVGTVNLSGNLSDYSYFEVYYGSSTQKLFIRKFPVGNSLFTIEYTICAATQPYVRYKTYDIVGNSFNVNTFVAYRINMNSGVLTDESNSAAVSIFKVIGYK